MGVRTGIVVCVTSFLLGALFSHWIADSLTLWKSPVTDEHLWTAASYYSILAKGPSQNLYFLAAVVVVGGTTILWSLNDFGAENIMFDGGSIFLFGTTIVVYLFSVLPSLAATFNSLPSHGLDDPIPPSLRNAVLELASNNLICSVALTGVLLLQAGRYWAESTEDNEEDLAVVEPDDAAATPKGGKSRARTPDISICDDKVKPLLQQRLQAS